MRGLFFLDSIGEIIRIIPKIDRIRLTTFWAKAILVPYLCPTLMYAPQLSATVRTILCMRLWMRTLTQDFPDLGFTVGTVALFD